MNKQFNWEKAGKRMPYTTPSEDFFAQMEENIWEKVKEDYLGQKAEGKNAQEVALPKLSNGVHFKLRMVMRSVIALAAAVVLFIVIDTTLTKQNKVTTADVDQSFNELSADDQAYLINIYQDDVFMNEPNQNR